MTDTAPDSNNSADATVDKRRFHRRRSDQPAPLFFTDLLAGIGKQAAEDCVNEFETVLLESNAAHQRDQMASLENIKLRMLAELRELFREEFEAARVQMYNVSGEKKMASLQNSIENIWITLVAVIGIGVLNAALFLVWINK